MFRIDHVGPSDAVVDGADAAEVCRADYAPITDGQIGSQYRFVNTSLTWEDAELDCENDALTNIAHLAVLDDMLETTAVRNYIIAKVVAETGGYFEAHVGYARNLDTDPAQFFAVTGEPVPATVPPWNMNEPNNGAGTGIPEPVVWFSRDQGLIDGPTTFQARYVCECDHRPVTPRFMLH